MHDVRTRAPDVTRIDSGGIPPHICMCTPTCAMYVYAVHVREGEGEPGYCHRFKEVQGASVGAAL